MPVTINWGDPGHTVVWENFTGQWSWSDFEDVCGRQALAFIRSVSHPVDIIADFRDSGSLPMGPAVINALNVLKDQPSNWRSLIIITQNSLIGALVGMARRVPVMALREKIHVVQSEEQARRIIATLNETAHK